MATKPFWEESYNRPGRLDTFGSAMVIKGAAKNGAAWKRRKCDGSP